MKISNTQAIIGFSVAALIGFWLFRRYQSKKAINQIKDDELSKTAQSSSAPEIPKMFIRTGTNIPAGAMSFVDDQLNSLQHENV